MQDTPDEVRGIHGTWLNAPAPTWWDDPNATQALDRFDEMQGPLQGLRFGKRSLKLELHVDFARQHPLFVCEHELGLAFAHSLWRVVELMRTMGWPVEPDPKASALLVAHGAILGTRTLVLGVSKLMPGHTFEWTPQGASQRPRVDLTSNRHVVQDMSEAIELVDRAFMASVQSMVATNEAHGCAQVNLLSGGLDSRLVLLATQQHASEVQSLCFARAGSLDQIIAAEVAQAQGTRHHFHSLGSGCVHDVAGHGRGLRWRGESFGLGPPQICPGGRPRPGHGGVGIGPNRQRPLHREGPAAHAGRVPTGPSPQGVAVLGP